MCLKVHMKAAYYQK